MSRKIQIAVIILNYVVKSERYFRNTIQKHSIMYYAITKKRCFVLIF